MDLRSYISQIETKGRYTDQQEMAVYIEARKALAYERIANALEEIAVHGIPKTVE